MESIETLRGSLFDDRFKLWLPTTMYKDVKGNQPYAPHVKKSETPRYIADDDDVIERYMRLYLVSVQHVRFSLKILR